MKFLECDLEQIIMKTDNGKLRDRGLPVFGRKKNQIKVGNYGILDIATFYSEYDYKHDYTSEGIENTSISGHDITIQIFELKKDKISLSSFAQGCNYVKGVQDYFQSTGRRRCNYNWELILVGRSVDESGATLYLPDLIFNDNKGGFTLKMFIYDYDVDGIAFEEVSGYTLINKGF